VGRDDGEKREPVPKAVLGVSCTQYSESDDVMSFSHARIASYSRGISACDTSRRTLLSALFHRTARKLPTASCSSGGREAR
jgi:hypothetical protein